ncbi:MAG: aminotransferase class III-fold pyridoxal phosphate-dependent enzyme [Planctomycetes bacterium]|nr:aminotransferase class III-fold pyridoxal phosphate-dependent enzyme [Planctomycetota bacterium]
MDEGLMKTYGRAEEVFVDGHGARLITSDGREFLDFLAGIAVSALGHGHRRLADELRDQVGRVVHLSNLFRHPFTEQVATRLCSLTGMAAAFFTNSGTEAMECALKLARKAMHVRGTPERTSFVALEAGFHGRSLGALSLTHSEKYRKPFLPLQQTTWIAPEDTAGLQKALETERPCALVLEPIQGEGGIRPLSAGFLQAARELCTATGTLLVHDEIQSGCGRTGRFLAGQDVGVTPDVVTLAKPIAAGLPMGACLATAALADTFQKGEHGSTFAGGPLVCRAALVFLREVEHGLLGNVAARGAELRAGLEALQREFAMVREVRGRGLMLGLRVHHSGEALQKALYRNGLIVNCTAGDVMRIVPPFVLTADDVQDGLRILRQTLAVLPGCQSTTPPAA